MHPVLKPLLDSSLGANVVVMGLDEVPPSFDVFYPLLSLPRVFGTTLHSIPATVPYLRSPPALVAAWRERLGTAGIKIGLVWRGNPQQNNDHNRSDGAARFLDLVAAFAGQVTFVSLQKDPAAEEWALMAPFVCDVNADLKTFADTAAIIANLDLVIAVDTSVAHLAGAMGKPVWVLLTFALSPRYMLERTDSPWYPSMRLFRQKTRGAWDAVMTEVTMVLASWLGAEGSPASATEPAMRWHRFERFLPGLGQSAYAEPPSEPHATITRQCVAAITGREDLLKPAKVLDIGCGQGLALGTVPGRRP